MAENEPLLPTANGNNTHHTRLARAKTAEGLESPWTHVTVISLIVIDALCVLIALGYAFLTDSCVPDEEGPAFLGVLERISEVITCLFVIEIPLSLFAFSWRFYAPFSGVHHAALHLFDAVVILTTFILEIVLKGRERELVALLVILRLWRLVKLVAGIAVGSAEIEEETHRKLSETEDRLREVEQRLSEVMAENEALKRTVFSSDSGK